MKLFLYIPQHWQADITCIPHTVNPSIQCTKSPHRTTLNSRRKQVSLRYRNLAMVNHRNVVFAKVLLWFNILHKRLTAIYSELLYGRCTPISKVPSFRVCIVHRWIATCEVALDAWWQIMHSVWEHRVGWWLSMDDRLHKNNDSGCHRIRMHISFRMITSNTKVKFKSSLATRCI